MNKSCIFKILYYVCFAFFLYMFLGIFNLNALAMILGVLNIVLTIIFILKSIKKKLENVNLLFPISYLIFVIVVVILMFFMNDKLIIPYIHISYYGTLIMFNYLLMNVYSVLSCLNGKHN